MTEFTELAPDLIIPRLLSGVWPISSIEPNTARPGSEAADFNLDPCLQAGFTGFDIAMNANFPVMTRKLFSAKATADPHTRVLTHLVPKRGALSRREVREAVEGLLRHLKIEHLDLLQIHTWNYSNPVWLDTLFWLQELREEGLIGHLGLCNFDAAHLRVALASGIKIRTNQIACSLFGQREDGDMAHICQQHGIGILVFGVLAGGFLSDAWLGKPEPGLDQMTPWQQVNFRRLMTHTGDWSGFQIVLEILKQVAARHEASVSAVSGRYLLDRPDVAGIILNTGSDPDDAMKEYHAILATELDRDDETKIQRALGRMKAVQGGTHPDGLWPGYREHPLKAAAAAGADDSLAGQPVYPVIDNDNGKTRVLSGAVWEGIAGYCRATRSGRRILVSGTTAVHGERLVGGNDPAAQTHFVIDKIQAAIESLGGRLEDVDRTRIFVNDIRHWEQIAGAHGERFGHIQPATTLVQAKLIGEEYLVEMEAEARVV